MPSFEECVRTVLASPLFAALHAFTALSAQADTVAHAACTVWTAHVHSELAVCVHEAAR